MKRFKAKFWRWVAHKVDGHIKPRYGVSINNNVLQREASGPVIECFDEPQRMVIHGNIFEENCVFRDPA